MKTSLMKNIIRLIVIAIVFTGCSKDKEGDGGNGFSANAKFYSTNFAYTQIGSNGPNRVWIFSNIDRTLDTYIETRGRFDFVIPVGEELTPGTYTTDTGSLGDTIEFTQGIEYSNGSLVSRGDDIAFATTGTSSFNSGTVTINSVTIGESGLATQIDLSYSFNWDNITVSGSYSGSVRINPN
jgi:hypothetical protein